MIEKKVHIKNFKSIYDLDLEIGRVNLFIGENGSGKSNLLEALVFFSASESNMLANEFLVGRGLRVPEPQLMRSAFKKDDRDRDIEIAVDNRVYLFKNENNIYSQWKLWKVYIEEEGRDKLNNFIIYSPENTSLRTFEKEGQIQPLGINGEGLLKLLKVVNSYDDKSYIRTIIEALQLFNWFKDITIPRDISSLEDKIIIQDRYLYREFTQRSANEGFLFILFYITLMVAKETPQAFAIDNIDASLNPKLCTKLMSILIDLATKYDKQIFLTTHNPAILDGININNRDEKVFVVSRDEFGYTQLKILTEEDNPIDEDGEKLHLSEAFLRGYLGGLPRGF